MLIIGEIYRLRCLDKQLNYCVRGNKNITLGKFHSLKHSNFLIRNNDIVMILSSPTKNQKNYGYEYYVDSYIKCYSFNHKKILYCLTEDTIRYLPLT